MVSFLNQPSDLLFAENLIAAGIFADERLASEERMTANFKSEQLEAATQLITKQVAEIDGLKAQNVQLNAQMKQLEATLVAAKTAERAELVTKINAQQSHITYLAGRVDRYVECINELFAVYERNRLNPKIRGSSQAMKAIFIRAKNII